MNEDTLRDRLNIYIKENGIKQNFIAEKIGLDTAVLSKWLRAKYSKPLWNSTIQAIQEYLNDREVN